MKREMAQTVTSVDRPIRIVLSTATTMPMRYSRSFSTRSLIEAASSAPHR